jgi:nucleotide-binding universal stress UspA family protein
MPHFFFPSKEAAVIKMKTILHPTDFSVPSNYALEYAVACATEFGAKLCILHVIHDVQIGTYFGMPTLPPPPQLAIDQDQIRMGIEKQVTKALEEILPPEVRGTIPVQYLIRHGAPFLEIIRCAEQIEADLIVCGTHGRTGLKHAIIGSVAEKVVRKSRCPVLSIRHPEHKFEMPTGA